MSPTPPEPPADIVARLRSDVVAEAISAGLDGIDSHISEFCVTSEETTRWARHSDNLDGATQLLADAADEIERLRATIRRALADGMGVLDDPEYDLYRDLAVALEAPR